MGRIRQRSRTTKKIASAMSPWPVLNTSEKERRRKTATGGGYGSWGAGALVFIWVHPCPSIYRWPAPRAAPNCLNPTRTRWSPTRTPKGLHMETQKDNLPDSQNWREGRKPWRTRSPPLPLLLLHPHAMEGVRPPSLGRPAHGGCLGPH